MHFACVHQCCERQCTHWNDGLYKELTGWDRLLNLVGGVGVLEISTLIMNYCHCSSSIIVCMHFVSLTQPRRKLTFSIISELSPHDETLVPIRCVQMYLFSLCKCTHLVCANVPIRCVQIYLFDLCKCIYSVCANVFVWCVQIQWLIWCVHLFSYQPQVPLWTKQENQICSKPQRCHLF